MDEIKDITIEHALIPWPKAPWQAYLKRLKLEAAKEKTTPRFLMSKYVPLLEELPTHFVVKEGKSERKPIEWPSATQDLNISCAGENECFILVNRGYLCARHTPSTSDLQVVSVETTNITPKRKLRFKLTL